LALERSLKEEKLNTVVLAQEIKSQRKLLIVKEQVKNTLFRSSKSYKPTKTF